MNILSIFFFILQLWVIWLCKGNPSSKTLQEGNTILLLGLSLQKALQFATIWVYTNTFPHSKPVSYESEILQFLELPPIDSTYIVQAFRRELHTNEMGAENYFNYK